MLLLVLQVPVLDPDVVPKDGGEDHEQHQRHVTGHRQVR